jgi:hypothetical protein
MMEEVKRDERIRELTGNILEYVAYAIETVGYRELFGRLITSELARMDALEQSEHPRRGIGSDFVH